MSATAPSGSPPAKALIGLYFVACTALVYRIAHLDEWSLASSCVVALFVLTALPDRVAPTRARLLGGVLVFAALSAVVAYFPDIWFEIAFRLNHASHYLWNANALMTRIPGNDGRFLWSHDSATVRTALRWVYLSGFDLVVWIPVIRSLAGFDALRAARYALAAHVIQFPLIMPFYTAIRVDEVWSVLGNADRCERGWTDEVRRDLGANCFPSMHTSVAFAILLLSLREKSRAFRWMMVAYATSIIVSTVYMEIHWIVDVAGGLLLGAGAVRLTDWLISYMNRPREAAHAQLAGSAQ